LPARRFPQLFRLTPKTPKIDEKGITGKLLVSTIPFGSLISDRAQRRFESLGYVIDDKVTVQISKKLSLCLT